MTNKDYADQLYVEAAANEIADAAALEAQRLSEEADVAIARAKDTGQEPVPDFADVSNHQETVRFERYAPERALIAIKITEGQDWPPAGGEIESSIRARVTEALGWAEKTGMFIVPYHYARPDNGNDPVAEANHFIKRARSYGLRLSARRDVWWRRTAFPGVLDYEERHPERKDNEWVQAWADRYKEKTNHGNIDYGGNVYRERKVNNKGRKFWLPAYVEGTVDDVVRYLPSSVDPQTEWLMWQFTNGQDGNEPHTLPGIPGSHDVNQFLGTRRDLFRIAI